MANEKYARAFVHVNGTPSLECTDVDIDRNPNHTSVGTIARGRAGVTPGNGITTVKFGTAVRIDGVGFDIEDKLASGDGDVITIVAGNRKLVVDGNWMSDSFKYANNSNAAFSVTFEGSYSKWEDL